MTVQEVVYRARSAIGLPTAYRMGGGSLDPRTPDPRDEVGTADCSAFACWVAGLKKYQPFLSWLRTFNGGWLNTDGIWFDATKQRTGFFEMIERPRVGAFIVYPSTRVGGWPGPKVGHIGLITEVSGLGVSVTKVVHCSSGNFRRTKDAIQETGPEAWERVGSTIYAWCATVGA